MYVYVIKFEGKPNLIKIGKSVSPEARNNSLSKCHGNIIYSDHYFVGDDCFSVESSLHRKYAAYNERVNGDGSTEFFSDIIYKDVSDYLTKFRTEEYQMKSKDYIESKLKAERKRYYNLIGKLLGYKDSNQHTGELCSSYVGMWDMMTLTACYSVGFPANEIHERFLKSDLNGKVRPRFTTPHRVGIAYKLFVHGTIKEKNLEQLLSDAKKRETTLLT